MIPCSVHYTIFLESLFVSYNGLDEIPGSYTISVPHNLQSFVFHSVLFLLRDLFRPDEFIYIFVRSTI